jgi:hypothetical protein
MVAARPRWRTLQIRHGWRRGRLPAARRRHALNTDPSVYISHVPADEGFCQALLLALVDAGLDARAESFGPDPARAEHVPYARECAVFIPLLSRAALASPRARYEAHRFYNTYRDDPTRLMLPVLLEPLNPDEIWPFLQESQRIEGPPGEPWLPEALIEGVVRLVTLITPARPSHGGLRQTRGPIIVENVPHDAGGFEAGAGRALMLRTSPPAPASGGSSGFARSGTFRGRNVQLGLAANRPVIIALVVAICLLALSVAGVAGIVGLRAQQASLPSGSPSAASAPTSTDIVVPTAGTPTVSPSPTHGSRPQSTATPLPAIMAIFVKLDTATQGSWRGVYGAAGYDLAPDGYSQYAYHDVPGTILVRRSLTPSTTVAVPSTLWAGSTTEAQALLKPAATDGGVTTDRIAATWYYTTTFYIDIAIADGQTHQVALYCVDWHGSNARTQRIDAIDPTSTAILDTRTLTQFSSGQYLVWSVRGHVSFKITNTGPSNAVVSGLFFD